MARQDRRGPTPDPPRGRQPAPPAAGRAASTASRSVSRGSGRTRSLTSMSPDARSTLLITKPRSRCLQRDWRLAPSTICVRISRTSGLPRVRRPVGACDARGTPPPSLAKSSRWTPSASPVVPSEAGADRTCNRASWAAGCVRNPACRPRITSSPPGASGDPTTPFQVSRDGRACRRLTVQTHASAEVGHPHQREHRRRAPRFPSGVVRQRRFDLLGGRCCRRHASAERLGVLVDDLDSGRPPAPPNPGSSPLLMPVISSTTSFIDLECAR